MATGIEPCSNEPGAPGEIRVLAPGWSPTASLATRAVYMRHAATLSSQRKSGHKSSDRERGQQAHPTTGEKQFYHFRLNGWSSIIHRSFFRKRSESERNSGMRDAIKIPYVLQSP